MFCLERLQSPDDSVYMYLYIYINIYMSRDLPVPIEPVFSSQAQFIYHLNPLPCLTKFSLFIIMKLSCLLSTGLLALAQVSSAVPTKSSSTRSRIVKRATVSDVPDVGYATLNGG